MCNPPIPTCMDASTDDGWVVVGHGDGQYTVLEALLSESGDLTLETALVAPGHESNGLVGVKWMRSSDDGSQTILTMALSGEVTLWKVGSLLTPAEEDDASHDALPDVLFAASTRESGGGRSVVNCLDAGTNWCVAGDESGSVYWCPMS